MYIVQYVTWICYICKNIVEIIAEIHFLIIYLLYSKIASNVAAFYIKGKINYE